jgi:uncharacterized protein (UPF0276 family)
MRTSDEGPLSAGLGLKPQHFGEALACRRGGLWFEVHPENYMVEGGPRLAWLETIRAAHPLSLHGVSLSLGGVEPPDPVRLGRLVALARRLEPALVSEHLAWSSWRGAYLPDLLPFPRTDESLAIVARNIDIVQEALGRSIATENPSHYMRLDGHAWEEVDFLAELSCRTGCRLLLDVNNVAVSAHNLDTDPCAYIDAFPADAVAEVHLAGHGEDPALGADLWIDSHASAVSPQVWALYERLVARIGPRPTLVERDADVPGFAELLKERDRAAAVLEMSRPAAAPGKVAA